MTFVTADGSCGVLRCHSPPTIPISNPNPLKMTSTPSTALFILLIALFAYFPSTSAAPWINSVSGCSNMFTSTLSCNTA